MELFLEKGAKRLVCVDTGPHSLGYRITQRTNSHCLGRREGRATKYKREPDRVQRPHSKKSIHRLGSAEGRFPSPSRNFMSMNGSGPMSCQRTRPRRR